MEYSLNSECVGTAFEFENEKEETILAYLREREGPSFELRSVDVLLPDNRSVQAFVPINRNTAHTYIGGLDIIQRARMAKNATGVSGKCVDYIANIRKKLLELNIEDLNVENFWQAVEGIISD